MNGVDVCVCVCVCVSYVFCSLVTVVIIVWELSGAVEHILTDGRKITLFSLTSS